MKKQRLEAFSDGVLAIIITIMVLEIKVPHGESLTAIKPLLPIFVSYVLGFINIGIYWNNHHHLFMAVEKVDGKVLWANIFLLFWLSLLPFTTGWMGENHFARWPVILLGIILAMAGIAYYILVRSLLALHKKDDTISQAIGNDYKGKLSVIIYIAAIPLAFIHPWISLSFYVVVAGIWFIPDKRIEDKIHD